MIHGVIDSWRCAAWIELDDERGSLDYAHLRLAEAVRDLRVDGGRANVLVTEVVLHELKRRSGVEQVRGDRVPQRMCGAIRGKPGARAVAGEEALDLPPSERPIPPGEERGVRSAWKTRDVLTEDDRRAREEDLLAPGATFEPPHQKATAVKVEIRTAQQRDFAHSKSVVVHQPEEGVVPEVADDRKEATDFVLGQVAWGALVWKRLDGQRRE